ncbi:MAG: FHA domain-containing protein, partial [Actinomycetota bacterium]|nr:FHA domain-containing protein [Actinomycetota bacterium]
MSEGDAMWVTIGSGEGKGVTVRVEGERFVVGSGAECHLIVRDERAAPLHAYLETRADGRVVLHDLGSEQGTFVNGERIDAPALLEGDEEIRVGDTTLVASVAEPEVETQLAGAHEAGDAGPAGRPPDGSVPARAADAPDPHRG